jgi:hypothetical protein
LRTTSVTTSGDEMVVFHLVIGLSMFTMSRY